MPGETLEHSIKYLKVCGIDYRIDDLADRGSMENSNVQYAKARGSNSLTLTSFP
jgi:hypothetical protein